MNCIHSDTRVPLPVRMDLANSALAYAAALVNGNIEEITSAKFYLREDVENCRICIKAYEMGMS